MVTRSKAIKRYIVQSAVTRTKVKVDIDSDSDKDTVLSVLTESAVDLTRSAWPIDGQPVTQPEAIEALNALTKSVIGNGIVSDKLLTDATIYHEDAYEAFKKLKRVVR